MSLKKVKNRIEIIKKEKDKLLEPNVKHIVKDYYEISKNLFNGSGVMKYNQKSNIILHPARLLMVGPSGSGKTNLLTDIALDLLSWSKIYIFAKNIEQPLFNLIKSYLEEKCNENDLNINDYFHMSNDIDIKIDDKNEDGSLFFNPKIQHLVIFDDMTHRDDKKNSSIVSKYLKYSRPSNCTIIVATQNFFDTSKNVRENANYVCCFKGKSQNDINEIRKWYADDLSKEEFKNIYNIATTKQNDKDKNAFLFIDTNKFEKGLKYQHAFYPYSLFKKDDDSNVVDRLGPIMKHPKSFSFHTQRGYENENDSD